MATSVKPIPEGYAAVTPYLTVRNAAAAIEFYRKVFDARERLRMAAPGGMVGHAELTIGDAVIMLSDEFPDRDVLGPEAIGGSPVTLHLYVDDVDRVAERALGAGCKVLRPVEDQFYGDRAGKFQDPFGHLWFIATHKEDVPEAEMARRMREMSGA
jgi:PhnB protein